jgi:hypothetical protein
MSWFRRLIAAISKPTEVKKDYSPSVRYAMEAMPTIKFDPSVVTKSVKADLRRNVELLAGVEKKHVKQIYELALRFIVGRRDFYSFCTEMMNLHIEGMTRSKAAEIGRSLANKAGAVIEQRAPSVSWNHSRNMEVCERPLYEDPNAHLDADVQQQRMPLMARCLKRMASDMNHQQGVVCKWQVDMAGSCRRLSFNM